MGSHLRGYLMELTIRGLCGKYDNISLCNTFNTLISDLLSRNIHQSVKPFASDGILAAVNWSKTHEPSVY